jgi:hypothetical protein
VGLVIPRIKQSGFYIIFRNAEIFNFQFSQNKKNNNNKIVKENEESFQIFRDVLFFQNGIFKIN